MGIIKHFPFYFAILFFCKITIHFLNMVSSSITSKLTFGLFENADTITIYGTFITLAMIFIINAAPDLFHTIQSFAFGLRRETVAHYRNSILYKRLFQNSTTFFLNRPSGQLVSRIQDVNSNLDSLTYQFWAEIFGITLGFLFVAGYVFSIETTMAIIIILNGAFRLGWRMYLQPKLNRVLTAQQDAGMKFQGARTDSLENAITVRQFGNEQYENNYIMRQRHPLIELGRRFFYLDRWSSLPVGLVWSATNIAILVISLNKIQDGSMSISDASFVIAASAAIFGAFVRLNNILRNYSESRIKASNAFQDIFDTQGIPDKPNAKKLILHTANISFENIDFAYNTKNILHKFNLDISSGEHIGIVGLSGSGKTTLCNLLLRLWDINNGAIKINNHDIRDITQESLRKNISLVSQEPTLFNRTIGDNIRYGRPNATMTQIINAAKKANIHTFITKLPNGYNTLVGNRGIKLSGGQRQRIAIARAILKNAPILILDEATSALDSKNEIEIQSALNRIMHGKTTIAIAHRLSTLRNMDRIIVMENGRIAESGTHNSLLRKNGIYKKLWSMQTNGFIKSPLAVE